MILAVVLSFVFLCGVAVLFVRGAALLRADAWRPEFPPPVPLVRKIRR